MLPSHFLVRPVTDGADVVLAVAAPTRQISVVSLPRSHGASAPGGVPLSLPSALRFGNSSTSGSVPFNKAKMRPHHALPGQQRALAAATAAPSRRRASSRGTRGRSRHAARRGLQDQRPSTWQATPASSAIPGCHLETRRWRDGQRWLENVALSLFWCEPTCRHL
jgi:hypothetical protein